MKLKACKSPEELLKLAREINPDITMDEIRNAVHGKTKFLSDEEMDQVAAGGCFKGDEDPEARNKTVITR